MSCNKETSRGVVVSGAGVAGVGTAVDLDGLFTAGSVKLFDEITVTNDGDAAVKVGWTNKATSDTDYIIVPHGGKTITHTLHYGQITSASLKVYSLSSTVAVTGNITINLSGSR